MENKRKISMVVNQVSFQEAEKADDDYWSKKSAEERLLTLVDLRSTFFSGEKKKIAKVIFKRSLYEEAS